MTSGLPLFGKIHGMLGLGTGVGLGWDGLSLANGVVKVRPLIGAFADGLNSGSAILVSVWFIAILVPSC